LLLTFLCLEYDESQDLPKKKATLYGNALDILLRRWSAEKRLPYEPIYRQLGIDLEKIMLAEIAYDNFATDKLFFSQPEVLNQIQKVIDNNDNAPKNLDVGKILDAITIEQGILVERARNVFSFSHLTLQEYLTAQHIYDNRLVEKLVTEHLPDKRWKEVFLLVAGVMRGGADDLLLLMEKEVQKYINTPKLQALLNWAEEVTVGSPGNYKPVGKRAVAIANANAIANTYTNAIAIADSYVNTKIDYIVNAMNNAHSFICTYQYARPNAYIKGINYFGEIEKLQIFNQKLNFTLLLAQLQTLKAKIPDDKQPEEVHLAFAKKFIETLLNGFNLTPEMVNLSEEEIKDLDKYLYANYLIIQCKEAALSVSKQIWETIETRMLLVKNN
ncbi:MAG: NACHT domain-containing protein, partial [Aphanizomenon sp.]